MLGEGDPSMRSSCCRSSSPAFRFLPAELLTEKDTVDV